MQTLKTSALLVTAVLLFAGTAFAQPSAAPARSAAAAASAAAPVAAGNRNGTLLTADRNATLPTLCSANGNAAGGYKPVSMNDASTEQMIEGYANLALFQFVNAYNGTDFQDLLLTYCPATLTFQVSIESACSQVVAGTNFLIDYQGLVGCASAFVAIPLEATVFVPLPSSGGSVNVTSVMEYNGVQADGSVLAG
jgi:hypothetical protein